MWSSIFVNADVDEEFNEYSSILVYLHPVAMILLDMKFEKYEC